MDKNTFIAALKVLGFKLIKEDNKYIATIGKDASLDISNRFYIKIYFYSNVMLSLPYIEVTGSKITHTIYMNYKLSYKFIISQELK